MKDKYTDEAMSAKAQKDRVYRNDDRTTRQIFMNRVENASILLSPFKEKCRRNFDFYRGFHWDEDVEDELENEDRKAITFNNTLSVVNSVTGSEITNRFTSKAEPRRPDAGMAAEMVNGTIRYMRDQTDAEFAESDAFQDNINTGMGILKFSQDYFETHEGRTRVDSVSVFNMLWDPYWRKTNLMDRKWDAEYEWWSIDDCIARWPDREEELESMLHTYEDKGPTEGEEFTGFITDGNIRWINRDLGELLVYNYQYIQLERYWLVFDEVSGKRIEMTVAEWKALNDNIKMMQEQGMVLVQGNMVQREEALAQGVPEEAIEDIPVPTGVMLKKNRYFTANFIGNMTMDDGPSEIQNGFVRKFLTCFKYKREDIVELFGLQDVMEDPQMFANKMLSQLSHIVNTNPKGAMLVEEGALKDPDSASEDFAKPNAVIMMEDGAITGNRVEIIRAVYPESQDKLYNLAVEAVTRVIGFSPYQLNAVDNLSRTNQAAFQMVQQNSQVMLSQPFDSLKLYRKEAARTYVSFIDAFMMEDQLIRIQSKERPAEVIPFKREWIENMEWDIIFDQTPQTASAQKEIWEGLQRHGGMEILRDAGVISPTMVVNMMPDIPETQRNEMRAEAAKNDAVGQALQALAQGNGEAALEIMQEILQQQQQGGGGGGAA